MLEDMGNAVKINDRIIPAMNIQVDGVPGVLDNGQWYNPYFEIMFETGELWVVEDRRKDKPEYSGGLREFVPYIVVEAYSDWNKHKIRRHWNNHNDTVYFKAEHFYYFNEWEDFLLFYDLIRFEAWEGEPA